MANATFRNSLVAVAPTSPFLKRMLTVAFHVANEHERPIYVTYDNNGFYWSFSHNGFGRQTAFCVFPTGEIN